MKEQIREVGLTENESKVYLKLLELGPSNAGSISRKSGLHRRVIYDTLEMLIQKGLIGYIKRNNIKLFSASNPNRFLEIIKEKEENINEVIPDMLNLFTKTKEKEETNFYKGKQGLKVILEDQLREKELLIIGASEAAYEIMQFYFKWYDKRRVANNIKARIIFHRTKKNMNIPLSMIRYFPQKYSSPLAVNIYGNKVALILWRKENPFAIVINDEAVALAYKKYFDFMWKGAKKSDNKV
jgi:sugar-specific transcriptional regulator TrmB